MATPQRTIAESISLFAEIGLDGIELVCQEGTPFHKDLPAREITEVVRRAERESLSIVGLTPYMWDINSADPELARQHIDGLKEYVTLAQEMGAGLVRAYGGRDGGDESAGWQRTVAALIEVGEFAADLGITIMVENHHGTLTLTGEATSSMVRAVGSGKHQNSFRSALTGNMVFGGGILFIS